MKYFSLQFTVEKSDYDAYYKDFGKQFLLSQLKRSLVTFFFLGMILILSATSLNAGLVVTVISVAAMTVLMPLVFSKKLSFYLIKSKNLSRLNCYDFYADHIVFHVEKDENTERSLERHLKMNGFTYVAESKTNFYFAYMNERILIIPKRVLDEEKYKMIKNLIDNYFSNIYKKV